MTNSQTGIWTIGKLLQWTSEYLGEHGSESPRLDAEVLLAHCMGCERIELYTRYDEPASESVRSRFRELVKQRAAGKPVAYIVGKKEFFSLEFEVTPAVMIPRPDSEFVVIEFLQQFKNRINPVVADVGTGSGNLAIAAAVQHPGARFYAIDVSADALKVAQRNAARHNVADRIEFLQGDLLCPLPESLQCDCIMSNPPYIPTAQIAQLPVGVREYEPRVSLDGGPTGLEVVARLIDQAGGHLKPGGWIIIEIGAPQEEAVRRLIQRQGIFELSPTVHDYAGHPRVISARKQS